MLHEEQIDLRRQRARAGGFSIENLGKNRLLSDSNLSIRSQSWPDGARRIINPVLTLCSLGGRGTRVLVPTEEAKMRPGMYLFAIAFAGCQLLSPPALPAPLPAPPEGDTVLLFDEVVPSTSESIREAVARRIPAGTTFIEVQQELSEAGFPIGPKARPEKHWEYTVSAPLLMPSRWGMVQDVRIRFSEVRGAEKVWISPARRLPESVMLEAHSDLRRLPGMPRAEAEALLRENGFAVTVSTMGLLRRYEVLKARKWGEPSPVAISAVLLCRVGDDGRIATVTPATDAHATRSLDGAVGMFPSRKAPLAEQLVVYAKIPLWTAGGLALGMLAACVFFPFALLH